MITSAQKNALITSLKQRQREVEQRLAMFGIRQGPYGLTNRTVSLEQSHIRRLRAALESLGPIFCSFGLYMATRVDLLPTEDCRELSCIPDQVEPSTTTSIRSLIKQEAGCWPEEIYRVFEEKPFASGLIYQQHAALLDDDQPVIVKLLHPEFEEFQSDLELLPLLKGAFVKEAWADSKIEGAIADFSQALRTKIDFVQQVSIAETLMLDTEVFGILRVPLVYKRFSTSRMLTVEKLPGKSLKQLIPLFQEESGKDAECADLAHRVCIAWLRQALLGSHFPVEPSPANITILPNGQISFTDGGFASLPTPGKANLWNYLIAATTEDPDHACLCLIREMNKAKDAVSESELRQRFRQIVPFRDYDWSSNSADNNLAANLLTQWRLAAKHGYSTGSDASSFFRALVTIVTVAQQLVAERDVLHRALQDVRLLAGVERCREMLSVQHLGEQMDRYLAVMMDLPPNLDSLLTLASEGVAARSKLQISDTARQRNTQDSLVLPVLVLAMIGLVLLPHRFTNIAGPWSSEISALMFVLLGILLLRVSARR